LCERIFGSEAELARREEDVTMHGPLDTQKLPELSFWHSANWRGTKKWEGVIKNCDLLGLRDGELALARLVELAKQTLYNGGAAGVGG
jgi:hypothetical protein